MRLYGLILSALKHYGPLTLRELCCAVNGKPLDGSFCRSYRCRYVYYAGDHSDEFNSRLRPPDCPFNYLKLIRAVKKLESYGLIHTYKAYRPDDRSKWGMDRFTIVRLGPTPQPKLVKWL